MYLVQNGIREICISKGILARLSSKFTLRPGQLWLRDLILFYSRSIWSGILARSLSKSVEPSIFSQLRSTTMVFMYASTLSRLIILEMGPKRCLRGVEQENVACTCTLSPGRAPSFFFFTWQEFAWHFAGSPKRQSLLATKEPEPKDHFDLTSKPYPSKEFLEDWLCEPVNWCGFTNQSSYILTGGSSMRVSSLLDALFGLLLQSSSNKRIARWLFVTTGCPPFRFRNRWDGAGVMQEQMDTADSWCYTQDLAYKTSKDCYKI